MKHKLLLTSILILILFSASFAQEATPTSQPKKLAFVNKPKFEDPNGGIEKLVAAIKSANGLQRNPGLSVRIDISKILKQLEAHNNVVILDVAELDRNGQITLLSAELDVTSQVIALINEYFKNQTIANPNLDLATARMASVSSKFFLDEKSGIKGISEKVNETKAFLKSQTGTEPTIDEIKQFLLANRAQGDYFFRIVNHMEKYAVKNNFNVVFESSGRLPLVLKTFQIQDVTKDFISYYNQLNP